MAFYKDLDDVKAPDWTGASKEPDKRPADTSAGTLLSNIGNIFGDAVDMADKIQNQSINDEARNILEPMRDQEIASLSDPNEAPGITVDGAGPSMKGVGGEAARDGVQTKTTDLTATDDDETLPAEAEASINQLGTLGTAAQVKTNLKSSYYDKLYATVRQLKNRYPGKRDVIDRAVSKITGVDPANALLNARMTQRAQALAAAGSEDKARWNEFRGDDGPALQATTPGLTFEQYKQNPRMYMAKAQAFKAENLRLQSDMTRLDLLNKKDKDGAEHAFNNYLTTESGLFINGALSKLQDEGLKLQAQGANVDPVELEAYKARLTNTMQTLKTKWQQFATAPRRNKDGGPAFTIQEHLGGAGAVNKMIEDTIKPMKDLGEIYSAKNEDGLANTATNILKQRGARDQLRTEQMYPEMRVTTAIRKSLGDPLTSVVLQNNKTILDGANRAMNDTHILNILNAPDPSKLPNLTQIDANRPEGGRENGKANKALIQSLTTAIKTGNAKQAINAATVLYGDSKFFNDLPEAQKKQAWALLTDPSYAEVLGKQPEVLQKHMNWIAETFPNLVKPEIDTIQKDVIEFNRLETEFQPDTMHFAFKIKDGQIGIGGSGFDEGPTGYRATVNDEASRAVANMNSAIDRVAPVFQKMYKDKAPEMLLRVMQGKGLNLEADKKGWFLEEAAKAIGGAVSDTAKGVVDKVKGALPETGPTPKTPEFRGTPQHKSSIEDVPENTITAKEGATTDLSKPHSFGRVFQEQGDKASVRRGPIQTKLAGVMERAASATGVNVEVYSGGQRMKGAPGHTGSHRHDAGGSGDVRLFTEGPDGKRQYVSSSTPEGRRKIAEFIKAAAAEGATGIGHGPGYMGDTGIHVGFGSRSVWGAKGSSGNAPSWVKQAYEQGVLSKHYGPVAAKRDPFQ